MPTGGTAEGGEGITTVVETEETVTVPGGAAPGGGDAGGEVVPDEETPLAGPQEVLDLDDEDVPLLPGRNGEADDNSGAGSETNIFYALIGVAVVGAGALTGVLIWLWKRNKKKKDVEKKDTGKKDAS